MALHRRSALHLSFLLSLSLLTVTRCDVATCSHTFPDGNTFDLSGLVKPGGYHFALAAVHSSSFRSIIFAVNYTWCDNCDLTLFPGSGIGMRTTGMVTCTTLTSAPMPTTCQNPAKNWRRRFRLQFTKYRIKAIVFGLDS